MGGVGVYFFIFARISRLHQGHIGNGSIMIGLGKKA